MPHAWSLLLGGFAVASDDSAGFLRNGDGVLGVPEIVVGVKKLDLLSDKAHACGNMRCKMA